MKRLLFALVVISGVMLTSCDGHSKFLTLPDPAAPDTVFVPTPPAQNPCPKPCHRRHRHCR